MKIGDIVVRKSYGRDIKFIISDINNGIYTIKGINLRIIADSPLEDLEQLASNVLLINEKNYERHINKSVSKILIGQEKTNTEYRSENTSLEHKISSDTKLKFI